MGSQGLQSGPRGLFRWVEECDIANQSEARLVGHSIRVFRRRQLFGCDRHHTQTIFVEVGCHLAHAGQQLRGQRLVGIAMARLVAHRQNLFHSAFADQHVMVLVLRDHHRHASALEVERNLIDFSEIRGGVELPVNIGVFQNGHIQQIF